MPVDLILDDALEVVRGLPDESFTACFCDPPYGLKFMGKEWDHGVPSKEVWAEILRVLKPGAILMAFGGPRTWHRLAVAIEDAGFELCDTMLWLYGSGFPKSHNIGKAIDKAAGAERKVTGRSPNWRPAKTHGGAGFDKLGTGEATINLSIPATDAAKTWEGYGTALKPSWEPILLCRKPRCATYAATAMEHGTACLNIDGCRIMHKERPKYTQRTAPRYSGRTFAAGVRGGNQSDVASCDPKGRWPANLLFSHSDCERVGVKRVRGIRGGCTKMGGVFGTGGSVTSKQKDYADPDGLETVAAYRCSPDCPVAMLDRQSGVSKSNDPGTTHVKAAGWGHSAERRNKGYLGETGGASRFFQCFERFYYCPKASRKERDMGLEGMETQEVTRYEAMLTQGPRPQNTPRKPASQRNPHPTVKPLALCEYLARLIVPPLEYRDAAQLLVPFCGSGSEMIGALMAGWRNVTGIDIVAEYLEIARLRIAAHMKRSQQMTLGDIDG